MLYLAYGSNLSIDQMNRRCPYADLVDSYILPDFELVFCDVATIRPAAGKQTLCALYDITIFCKEILDIYEGVETGKYKVYTTITQYGKAIVYAMPNLKQVLEAPTEWYADKIRQGYRDWCLDLDHLESIISTMPERNKWNKWDNFDWNKDYYTQYGDGGKCLSRYPDHKATKESFSKEPVKAFKANKTNYQNISTDKDRIETMEWNKKWALKEG